MSAEGGTKVGKTRSRLEPGRGKCAHRVVVDKLAEHETHHFHWDTCSPVLEHLKSAVFPGILMPWYRQSVVPIMASARRGLNRGVLRRRLTFSRANEEICTVSPLDSSAVFTPPARLVDVAAAPLGVPQQAHTDMSTHLSARIVASGGGARPPTICAMRRSNSFEPPGRAGGIVSDYGGFEGVLWSSKVGSMAELWQSSSVWSQLKCV